MDLRPLIPAFLFCLCGAACKSEITETVDADREAVVELLADCLPEQLDKLSVLLEFAKFWRLADGENLPNPAGTSASWTSGGDLQVVVNLSGYTLVATIAFYSPAGVHQNLGLTTTVVSQAIEAAADALRTAFTGSSFLVAEWVLAGAAVAGAGAITAVLAPAGQPNRLMALTTTATTPAGGPPPADVGTIALSGSHACTLTFQFAGLRTDFAPASEFPVGDLLWTLEGTETTASGRLRVRGVPAAKLLVDRLLGYFAVDLETYAITPKR